jgi:hypothetical protein
MTNTEFLVREYRNVHRLAPEHNQVVETSFGVLDIALVAGFVVAFIGLVFLLAK